MFKGFSHNVLLAAIAMALLACLPVSAQTKHDLSLQLQPGQTYRSSIIIAQNISQSVLGSDMKFKQSIGMGVRVQVENVDADGAMHCKITYDWSTFALENAQGKTTFDSRKDSVSKAPTLALGQVALVGESFGAVLQKDGSVKELQGVAEMIDRIAENLQVPAGVQADQFRKLIREHIEKNGAEHVLKQIIMPYPKSPVAVGESWERTREESGTLPMKIKSTYTLRKMEGEVATIEVRGAMQALGEQKIGNVTATVQATGQRTGQILLSPKTGWIKTSTTEESATGKLTLPNPTGGTTEIPMTIDGTITISDQ